MLITYKDYYHQSYFISLAVFSFYMYMWFIRISCYFKESNLIKRRYLTLWLELKIFPDKWLFWKLKLLISDSLCRLQRKKKSTWMIYLLYNFIKFHMYILVYPNQENIYLKSVLKSINNCGDDFKSKCIVHFWNVKLYTNLFLLSFWSRKCVSW